MGTEPTEEEKRAEEARIREAQQASWSFGDILSTGFWGVLFAGLAILTGGMALRQNWFGLRDTIQESGLQGMLMANMLSFGDPIYNHDTLKQAFLDATPEVRKSVIEQALNGTGIELGDKMLSVIASDEHENTLVALLEQQGFKFNAPALTGEAIQTILQGAITASASEPQEAGAAAPNRALVSALLGSARDDLRDAAVKAGVAPEGMLAWLQSGQASAISAIEKTFGVTITGKAGSIQTLFASGGIMAGLLEEFSTESAALIADLLGAPEVGKKLELFLKDKPNRDALSALLNNVSETQLTTVSNLLTQLVGGQTPDFAALLQNPEIMTLLTAENSPLLKFLDQVKMDGIEGAEQFGMMRDALFADSDVAGKSNFDILAETLTNESAKTALTGILSALSSGDFAALEAISVDAEVAGLVNTAIRQMDFDNSPFLEALYSIKPAIGLAVNAISKEDLEGSTFGISNLDTANAALWGADIPVVITPEMVAEVATYNAAQPAEVEGNLDTFIGTFVGSAVAVRVAR